MVGIEPSGSQSGQFVTAVHRFRQVARSLDLGETSADELEVIVEAIRRAQASLDAALLRVGVRADELAATGTGPSADEALTGRGQVRARTARREAARARLAKRSPALQRAMTDGTLGPDHLDSLSRRLAPLDDETLARLDVDLGVLAADADRLPADTFDAALRRAVESAGDDGAEAAESKRSASECRHWFDRRTGLGHLHATLDPERYEALVTAIDQHTTALANGADVGRPGQAAGTAKNASLAAEALVDLVCSSGARAAHLPHITIVVDHETVSTGRHPHSIAETGNGLDLTDDAVARLCCDSVLQRVALDAVGVPIDVGRRSRTATAGQWAALRSIYRSCAWGDCDRPLSHCQAHHIRPWQHGGATDLHNLVPLCSRHHHLVHEGRWHIELLPDRAMRIRRPDGQQHRTCDPPTRRPPPLAEHRPLTTEEPALAFGAG